MRRRRRRKRRRRKENCQCKLDAELQISNSITCHHIFKKSTWKLTLQMIYIHHSCSTVKICHIQQYPSHIC